MRWARYKPALVYRKASNHQSAPKRLLCLQLTVAVRREALTELAAALAAALEGGGGRCGVRLVVGPTDEPPGGDWAYVDILPPGCAAKGLRAVTSSRAILRGRMRMPTVQRRHLHHARVSPPIAAGCLFPFGFPMYPPPPPSAGKHAAARFVAESLLGVEAGRVVVSGDAPNDLDLLAVRCDCYKPSVGPYGHSPEVKPTTWTCRR
jgi:hypothetical protein